MTVLCLLALLGLGACSKTPVEPATATQENTVQAPATADEAKEKDMTKNCKTSSGTTIDEKAWADGSNALALQMLKANSGNTIASAYSAERALGMVLEGACSETADQMQKALFMPKADNLSETGMKIEKSLLDVSPDIFENAIDENGNPVKNDGPAIQVQIDNRVWVEKTYKIQDSYLETLKQNYSAGLESVDFQTDAENVRKSINAHVATATHDKIQDILPPNSVDAGTRLVLTNAVYFKAPWAEQFNAKLTQKGEFKTAEGAVEVDMMRNTESFGYFEDDTLQAIALGFAGSSYDFLILMPKLSKGANPADALSQFEATMDAKKLRTIMENIQPQRLKLTMPKFRIEASTQLKPLLAQLGMERAFTNRADFSGISSTNDLHISDVFHKAFIEIDETGAEAAAATAAVMVMRAALRVKEPIPVTVDHPFMFSIIERNTTTSLFMGRKVDFK